MLNVFISFIASHPDLPVPWSLTLLQRNLMHIWGTSRQEKQQLSRSRPNGPSNLPHYSEWSWLICPRSHPLFCASSRIFNYFLFKCPHNSPGQRIPEDSLPLQEENNVESFPCVTIAASNGILYKKEMYSLCHQNQWHYPCPKRAMNLDSLSIMQLPRAFTLDQRYGNACLAIFIFFPLSEHTPWHIPLGRI